MKGQSKQVGEMGQDTAEKSRTHASSRSLASWIGFLVLVTAVRFGRAVAGVVGSGLGFCFGGGGSPHEMRGLRGVGGRGGGGGRAGPATATSH